MRRAELKVLLDGLPPEARRLVLALGQVVQGIVPHAVESLAWGSLSFHRPQVGGRVNPSRRKGE
jgi:hypothetical protein